MKKAFSLILALALALCCFSFTASADEAPVVLTVAVSDGTNIEDFNTNEMTLYIEEKLGVDLQITAYDSSEYDSKINIMINAGDKLEDIIIGGLGGDAAIFDYAQQGAIIPLTEYYYNPEIAVNLTEAIERVGFDFRGAMTMPDGEIYGIASLNQSWGNEYGNGRAWVYTPWLEALGATAPTTTAELEALLEKAVATDLNGNGQKDEIGLAGYDGISGQWFNWLMNAFTYCNNQKDWMQVNDGVVSFAYTTDEWRQGIEYIRGLMAKGLIPTENLTQDLATGYTGMVNTEDVTCFMVGYTNADRMTDIERKGLYTAVLPVTGPNGNRTTMFSQSVPSTGMVITADCENPEMAFRVGDLMVCEELSITTRFGKKGVEWDYVSELEGGDAYECPYAPQFPAYIAVYHDSEYWGSGAMQNVSWMQKNPFIRQYGIAAGMAYAAGTMTQFDLEFANGATLYQNAGLTPKETVQKLIYSAEEQQIVTDVKTDLNTYIKETNAAWLTGAQELNDDTWNAYLKTIESMNAAEWLKVAQAAYDRSVGK